ncbi:MAG: VOC family protein, partial [Gemmatimonadota bacterium]
MALELDHVFVAAAYEGPEMELLADAGFLEGRENDHPGQGTASRGIFFENAYLELIWLTDPEVARSPAIQRTRLADRLDPTQAGNPVGFGLRSPSDPVPPAPFGTWPFAPPYLPPGAAFAMGTNAEMTSEPLLFVLPWARTPGWEPPPHPNGARRITRVTLVHPAAPVSEELRAFLALGLVSWEEGPE